MLPGHQSTAVMAEGAEKSKAIDETDEVLYCNRHTVDLFKLSNRDAVPRKS